MPLTPPLPSADSDYAAPPGMRLNKAAWDAALTSLGARLRSIEAQRADLQAVIDTGTDAALAMINENVTPLIEAMTEQLDALSTEASSLSGTLATLLAGGVPASSVPIAAIAGMSSTNTQAALAELKGAINTNTTNIAVNTTAIASAATMATVIAMAVALG